MVMKDMNGKWEMSALRTSLVALECHFFFPCFKISLFNRYIYNVRPTHHMDSGQELNEAGLNPTVVPRQSISDI